MSVNTNPISQATLLNSDEIEENISQINFENLDISNDMQCKQK